MPKWTKKDYEMVAEVLRNSPLGDDRDILVQAFARRFRDDNPLFDSMRFDAAVFRGELTRKSTARRGGWTTGDYRMIADVIRNSIASSAAKAVAAQMFADRLYYDNSRFDSDRFFKAALGLDYKTRFYHYGPTTGEDADAAWRVKYGFPPFPLRRRPEVSVRRYVRRAR